MHTRINHQEDLRTNQLVSQIYGMPIPTNKAECRQQLADRPSSSIHQDGVLKNRKKLRNHDARVYRPEPDPELNPDLCFGRADRKKHSYGRDGL